MRGFYLNFLIFTHLGEGNGRLCRILSSYLLSTFSPFPTPVYNVWTDSSKYDYQKALYDTRNTNERHPTTLTTMIIECSYHGWKHFFSKNRREKKVKRKQIKATTQLLVESSRRRCQKVEFDAFWSKLDFCKSIKLLHFSAVG